MFESNYLINLSKKSDATQGYYRFFNALNTAISCVSVVSLCIF